MIARASASSAKDEVSLMSAARDVLVQKRNDARKSRAAKEALAHNDGILNVSRWLERSTRGAHKLGALAVLRRDLLEAQWDLRNAHANERDGDRRAAFGVKLVGLDHELGRCQALLDWSI